MIIAEKGYASRELDHYLAEHGFRLIRPSYRKRKPHPGTSDVVVLRAEALLHGIHVSGLVYDVTIGLVHPAAQQEEQARG
ncbi:hypothetical protein [Amycolatopsis sp. SID8362]|uniref:hypothetical protein n=1 Tax=Amycolatopsis sp. SID8362 TaxID=2690346 RepID=UPI001EF2C050|nr:hypothetical protein [Amycolatopsis sp. SID8362]